MKKAALAALLISACLFSACGGEAAAEENIEKNREGWVGAGSVSFLAEVDAEGEDESFACTVRVTASDAVTEMEVMAPELIAGVKARLGDGGAELEYDGAILSLGGSLGREASPLAAMPKLMYAIVEGHISQIWFESDEEGEYAAAKVFLSEKEDILLWFDEKNLLPVYAELVYEGKAVVKCHISDFTAN